MKPYTLHQGDCLEVLKTLPDNSIDSIVTDPPYGLSKEPDMAEVLKHWLAGDDYQHKGGGFMGKSWDSFVPGPAVWKECLRVLKPGGHLLAFFGSRIYDMGTLAIRLAGFEVRDQIMWVYGSGFPKSLDVSKAVDGHATSGRSDSLAIKDVNLTRPGEAQIRPKTQNGHRGFVGSGDVGESVKRSEPATESGRQWQGWGTALKPAHEPIVVARKPLIGTVSANVLEHGTGALNIDGCRVHAHDSVGYAYTVQRMAPGADQNKTGKTHQEGVQFEGHTKDGRWPANVIHDGSEEVVSLFPANAGAAAPVHKRNGDKFRNSYGTFAGNIDEAGSTFHADQGSAARFFCCAKASRKDRNEGMADPGPQFQHGNTLRKVANAETKGNTHPTVKPTDLMAYLVRLVTPPGGTVVDPYMGSGSTGKAAIREGFKFIGIDRDTDENGEPLGYLAIAEARITHEWKKLQEPEAEDEPEPPQLSLLDLVPAE